MTEAQIESKMVRMVRDRGGLCYKFVSPNNPGVPDRLIITPDGRTIYVELKTPIGKLAPVQKYVIAEMQKRGADVRTLYGWDAVKSFVEEMIPICQNATVIMSPVPTAESECTGHRANG